MDRYSFSFVTHKGLPVTVNIYDTDSTTSKRTTLIPSANPLTITMQSSDNPMEPVRYTSAKINVLCKSGEVLELTNNLRYFVQIIKDGENIFTGFLRAEAYTQGYSSTEETFTYNAVDFLGASDGIKLTDDTLSMADVVRHLAGRITEAVPTGSADISSLFIVGDSLPRKNSSRVTTTLNLKTRAENWRQDDEDKREQTYASVLEFIREWCTFFGMTAFCNGEDLFIGSADDTGRYTIGSIKSLASGATLTDIFSSMGAKSFADLTPTGQHTIDYKQPAQKVEMTFGGDGYDLKDFPELSFESLDTTFVRTFSAEDNVAKNTKNEGFYWFLIGTKNAEDGDVKLYRRNIVNHRFKADAFDDVTSDNLLTCAAGASFIRQDYWGTNEEDDPGSTKSGEIKRNYELEDILYIWGKDPYNGDSITYVGQLCDTMEDAIDDAKQELGVRAHYPIVEIKSSKPITIEAGSGICISFDSAVASMVPLKYSRNSGAACAMSMSLRIGNKWWNGSAWSNSFARFEVSTEKTDGGGFKAMREVVNTKTLNQTYTCNGYSIPIPTKMSGQFEAIIYAFASTFVSNEYGDGYDEGHIIGYIPHIYAPEVSQIKNFRIEACEPFKRSYQKSYDPTRRLYETNTGGMDEVSAQTTLSSGEQVAENFGIVEETTKMTNVPTALTGSAETLTFDRMKRLNFAPAKRVTISANGDIPIPATFYAHHGETYRIESATDWNVIEDTVKLILIKKQWYTPTT